MVNPHIVFTFSDGTTQDTYNIIKNSIIIDLQRLKELKASSNKVTFTLKREPLYSNNSITLTGKILTAIDDIKAQLKDGDSVLFTGYISNNKKWSINQAGSVDITLNIEDVGIRRLKTPVSDNSFIFHDTVSNIVKYIADIADVEVASNQPSIDTSTYLSVAPSLSCNDALNDLLMEYGYVYYFNNEGKLCWEKLNLDAETYPTRKLWANSNDERYSSTDSKLGVRGKSAIEISRNISAYNKAGVTYSTLTERTNQKIFDACANGTELKVAGSYWWDGVAHEADRDTFTPTVNFSQNFISAFVKRREYQINEWRGGTTSVQIMFDDVLEKTDLIGHLKYSVYLAKKVYEKYWDGTGYRPSSRWHYERVSEEKTFEHSFSFFSDTSNNSRSFFLNCNGEAIPEYLIFEYHSFFGTAVIKNCRFGTISISSSKQGGEVEAVDIKQGKKIWEIKNLVATMNKTSSASPYQAYIKAVENKPNLSVLINNTSGIDTVTYNKFEASADIVATEFEENWVYSNSELPDTKMYKYESKYIHDYATAKQLVSNLAKYYTFCQNIYTFYTSDDLELNSVVNLIDNMFSGLNINVCITSKVYTLTDGTTSYKYSGYAISDIGYVSTRSEGYIKQNGQDEPFRFNYRGDWSASSSYTNNASVVDIVFYDGSSWMCSVSNTGNVPSEGSIYWAILAKKGDTTDTIYDFRINCNSSTYIRNKRASQVNNIITVKTIVTGYTGTPTVTVDNGLTITDGILEIPYSNSYDKVTITATLAGAPTQTFILSVVDNTEYNVYMGVAASNPPSSMIAGDCYFNSSDNNIYYYNGTNWVTLADSGISSAEKSEICAKAQKDVLSTIPSGTVTSSEYGYFNNIITDTVNANYIGSKDVVVSNAIRSSAYDASGNKVSTGKGFYLGASGQLKAEDAELISAKVDGLVQVSNTTINAKQNVTITPTTRTFTYKGKQDTAKTITMSEFRSYFPFDGGYVFSSGKIGDTTLGVNNPALGTTPEDHYGYVDVGYVSDNYNSHRLFGIISTYKFEYGNYIYADDTNQYVVFHDAFVNCSGPGCINTRYIFPVGGENTDWSNITPSGRIGSARRKWGEIWGDKVYGAVFNG